MARINWIHIVLVVILAVIVLVAIRLHLAAGQGVSRDATEGLHYAQAWCTECHSVEPETAGTGKFAPDFTVIAKRRTAHWLNIFLRSEHEIMPDFVFKTSEIDAIVTYIVSLKRR